MVFRGKRARVVLVVAATVFALGVAGCGGSDNEGSLTITTDIDFKSEPYEGTFEVSEGEDVLGCSSGAFVDHEVGDGVNKVSTCADGERSGTFTIFFEPRDALLAHVSPWRVVAATGDFSGLEGEGDFSLDVNEDDESGVETFTGDIEYAASS